MAENDQQDSTQNNGDQAAGQQADGQVKIQRIYVKDCSFESPAVPQAFEQQDSRPEYGLNVTTQARQVGETLFEVTVILTVDAKQNDQTLFLVEVQQAGLFGLSGFDEERLGPVLGAFCPAQLYPYARERATSMITHGGFPAPQLHPVNFERLYAEQVRRNREARMNEGASSSAEN